MIQYEWRSNSGMRKRMCLLLAFLLVLVSALSGCSAIKYRYNERCWWDHQTPTMKITNNSGKDVYICESCASGCMYCDEKATKFGFNLLGGPIPVCSDCYER